MNIVRLTVASFSSHDTHST